MNALIAFSLLLTGALVAAEKCDCGRECGKAGNACCCQAEAAAADTTAPQAHPLKGVVTALMPERTALMVKHEEVPGVMRAMTMMFKVEPAVLTQVKKGDAIQALMSKRDDGWWLHEVRVVATPTK